MESLQRLNKLAPKEAKEEFLRCCGSKRWAAAMLAARPFRSVDQLFKTAQSAWRSLAPEDWLEAFRHHPKIGALPALHPLTRRGGEAARKGVQPLAQPLAEPYRPGEKGEGGVGWAAQEQSGVNGAPEDALEALARGNREYESKFGYIFIVCATGKTAPEMLALLRSRLPNSPEAELRVAAEEQSKITRIRLKKLLDRAIGATPHAQSHRPRKNLRGQLSRMPFSGRTIVRREEK